MGEWLLIGDYNQDLQRRGIPKEQTIVGLSEGAARPLFSIKDAEIKEKVISHIENALNRKTPQGGQYKKLKTGDVKRAASFCDEHPEISDCSTHAVMALIRIKDKEIRDRAISLVKSFLPLHPTSPIPANENRADKAPNAHSRPGG